MLNISNSELARVLDYSSMRSALKEIFSTDFQMPLRHHHFYSLPGDIKNAMILMPAWTDDYMGIKQVVVAPENAKKSLPTIHALYTLMDAKTGEPLAIMNAALLTAVRTACTSALAADYLARKDAANLLVIGTGKVAGHLVPAHLTVRKYKKITIWGRTKDKALLMQKELKKSGYDVEIAENLEYAVHHADVIACATMAEKPLIKGEWLRPGQHLDLSGSYKPSSREADDNAVTRSSLFVDSREGALHESGELAIPLQNKLIVPTDIKADIVELCKGLHAGRVSEEEITLFKSVGLAIEDLAAALLVYKKLSKIN